MTSAPSKEWLRLQKLLDHYDDLYYNQQSPIISDHAYDILKQRFLWLSERLGHKTTKIGHPIDTTSLPSIRHEQKMLSIDSAHEGPEAFLKRIHNKYGAYQTMVVQPKIDGVALSLKYTQGALLYGATRGDGETGEDVTINTRQIANIPHNIPLTNTIFIRGEVYIEKENFIITRHNFKSTRNAASGILRKLAPTADELQMLRFLAYDATPIRNTHFENLEFLQSLGFQTTPSTVLRSSEECIDHYKVNGNSYLTREAYPYALDGMVYKINSYEACEEFGYAARAPRWAFACKFCPYEAIARIVDIKFQIGRTGVIIPTIRIPPTPVNDIQIYRVGMHNSRIFAAKQPRIGDQALITRAGDVSPYLSKVFTELRTGNEIIVDFPKNCPSCNHPLVEENCFHRCPAQWKCPQQAIARLCHFVHSIGMTQLSIASLTQFYNIGLVKTIPDLYTITESQILAIKGWGIKSWKKIQKQLSTPIILRNLIVAIGIDGVGNTTADLIASTFQTWDKFCNTTQEEFAAIRGIGTQVTANIEAFLKTNQELLQKLSSVTTILPAPPSTRPLTGQIWVITGTLPISRKQIIKLLVTLGAHIGNDTTTKTHAVLYGKDPGPKLTRATFLGIKTVNFNELCALVPDALSYIQTL